MAQAQQQTAAIKGESEVAKHQHAMEKLDMERKINDLESQLKQAQLIGKTATDIKQHNDQLDFDYDKLHTDAALKLVEIEASAKQNQADNLIQAQSLVQDEQETGTDND
jgi:hypothetical protein